MKEGLHAILNKMIVEGGLRVMKSWIQLLNTALAGMCTFRTERVMVKNGDSEMGGIVFHCLQYNNWFRFVCGESLEIYCFLNLSSYWRK